MYQVPKFRYLQVQVRYLNLGIPVRYLNLGTTGCIEVTTEFTQLCLVLDLVQESGLPTVAKFRSTNG
eukprot:SAG31_NODE_27136_length_430_cov_3.800604_1_plen_67_part_00